MIHGFPSVMVVRFDNLSITFNPWLVVLMLRWLISIIVNSKGSKSLNICREERLVFHAILREVSCFKDS